MFLKRIPHTLLTFRFPLSLRYVRTIYVGIFRPPRWCDRSRPPNALSITLMFLDLRNPTSGYLDPESSLSVPTEQDHGILEPFPESSVKWYDQ